MNDKQGYVYLMTNKRNNVIYTGVAADLQKRVFEHREKYVDSFTKTYKINKLVYYEPCDSIEGAILREKQIKAGSRAKKVELIQSMNPRFKDLYYEL